MTTQTITLHQALRAVSDHCDHARTHDTVGFSGLDAGFANKIAQQDRISPKVEWYVARFVRKYRRQVVENYERAGVQITQGLKGKAKVAAVDAFLVSLVWEHQSEEEVKAAGKPRQTISAASGAHSGTLKHYVARFPYNAGTLDNLKALVDWRDRKFDKSDPKDPKWIIQPTQQSENALRALVNNHGFVVTDGAAVALGLVAVQKVA